MSFASEGRSDHPLGECGQSAAADDAGSTWGRAGRVSRRRRTSYPLGTVQESRREHVGRKYTRYRALYVSVIPKKKRVLCICENPYLHLLVGTSILDARRTYLSTHIGGHADHYNGIVRVWLDECTPSVGLIDTIGKRLWELE